MTDLEALAIRHFDCAPPISGKDRESRARVRKRARVLRVAERYRLVMAANTELNRD